jgi:hypothetical protein
MISLISVIPTPVTVARKQESDSTTSSLTIPLNGPITCLSAILHAEARMEKMPTTKLDSSYGPWEDVGPSQNVRNGTNKTEKFESVVMFESAKTKTSMWEITGTAGLELGGKVGIPLVTEGSVKVSVSIAAKGGGSTVKTITTKIFSPVINVPAWKTVEYVLKERYKTVNSKWTIPMEFSGVVGADFGQKVNGSYYWWIPAKDFFNEFTANGNKRAFVEIKEKDDVQYQIFYRIY